MESLIFNQKKCQSIVIKTMAAIAVAGVGMMVMCSSSLAAALMMGGEEKEDPVVATKDVTTPVVPVIEKYRYVRIYRDQPAVLDAGGHWMNPAEVEVFSEGVNVAAGKTVTGSSLYAAQFPHSNLVDGNKTNFAHTNNAAVEWFLIDLGEEYEIDSVAITNRTQCCQARMENTKIQLSKTSDMTTSEDSRVITKAEAGSASFTWTVASDTIVVA
jgi:hypothetical protein